MHGNTCPGLDDIGTLLFVIIGTPKTAESILRIIKYGFLRLRLYTIWHTADTVLMPLKR